MKRTIISILTALALSACALLTSCGGNTNEKETEIKKPIKKAETMVNDLVDGARNRLEEMSEWATHDNNDYVIDNDSAPSTNTPNSRDHRIHRGK